MISQRISDLDDALASCMKCGFCKAVCPLFLGEETTSPRAKVRLARAVARGEIGMTERFKEQMERCLNCRACTAECPSGVEPNKVALAGRSAFAERDGLPLLKRIIFSEALKRTKLMTWGSRAAGIAQRLSGINLQVNPFRGLLPVMGMRRDKDLPMMGRKTLFNTLPENLDPFSEQKTTVVYFPGCATNLIYPEIGIATVNILRKLGARVILPHDLVCCSTPVFNSGDIEDARTLARKNIDIISAIDTDFVITACGSCGLTLKHEWTEVLGLKEAGDISAKVLDISEFITRFASDTAIHPIEQSQIVTYHDSCHLRRGMGVYEAPRQLLKAALGDKFVEMESADRCCGGGGTFSIYHPELSQTVAETKMQCLERSGADTVATCCPACMMQLRDSIVHRKMRQTVAHTAQILDNALKESIL